MMSFDWGSFQRSVPIGVHLFRRSVLIGARLFLSMVSSHIQMHHSDLACQSEYTDKLRTSLKLNKGEQVI